MRILWVKTNLLHPLDSGGTLRSYHMLRHLNRHHQITYVTLSTELSPPEAERAPEYCDRLVLIPWSGAPTRRSPAFYGQAVRNLRSEYPLALERYRQPAVRESIMSMLAEEDYDLAVSDFLTPAMYFDGGHGLPKLMFQHNVETLIWERMAERAGLIGRAYYRSQARRMRHWEGELARQFDHVVTVSPEDAQLMQDWFGLDAVTSVPTGVDADFYHTGPEPHGQDVVFVGSLDWLPNIDGVQWFLDDVWPAIRKHCPQATFHVVGRRPGRRMLRMLADRPDVRLWADVPDVRDHLWSAAVVVVPLRVGGGTRLKIFEALACGKAVVSTAVGAEGLGVTPDRHLVIASQANEMAEAVVRLLHDAPRRRRLGEAGRHIVVQQYSWQRAAKEFADVAEKLVASGVTSR